jgi:hypothetical protein
MNQRIHHTPKTWRQTAIGIILACAITASGTGAFSETNNKSQHIASVFLNDTGKNEPVNLVLFDASFVRAKIMLHWITATEKATSHYIIQRSTDGIVFEDAGVLFTEGDGNSSSQKDYKFPDQLHGEKSSTVFYRLKVVGLNREYSFSKVISIKNKVRINN